MKAEKDGAKKVHPSHNKETDRKDTEKGNEKVPESEIKAFGSREYEKKEI